MTQRIVPMTDRVLVKPHTVTPRKTGGLAVPAAQEEEPTTGVVVAVGPDAAISKSIPEHVEDASGWFSLPNIKGVAVGWVVVWRQHSGFDITINGETFKTLRLEEIEMRLVEE